MPQHKQPVSLQGSAVKQVAKMVFYSLLAIISDYDLYEWWPPSLEKEVGDLQEFLLTKIRPLWDEVCEVLCDIFEEHLENNTQFQLRLNTLTSFRILSTFMIHDRMRTLKITQEVCSCFSGRACLNECQIRKLKNIQNIDIQYNIKVTDQMLEMIGSICNKLNEIRIVLDSRHVKLESLKQLLKCRELQILNIRLKGWKVEEYEPYVLKLLTDLPELKAFEGLDKNILPKLTSVTSLEYIDARICNEMQLKNIIKMCPNAQQLFLINDSKTNADIQRVQTCLAESAWQVNTICINNFIFDQSMCHLLELKGRNLTKLQLVKSKGSDITLNEICLIGVNCPQLKTLDISEYDEWYEELSRKSPILSPETSIVSTPPMFCNLEFLHVILRKGWDIHLLRQIILHAKGLKRLKVDNVYSHGFCDVLAEILSVNPMTELERLCFKTWSYNVNLESVISVGSIKHLIESCPKLNFLNLFVGLKKDTFHYLKNLSKEAQQKNLNLKVTVQETLGGVDEDWLEHDLSESDDYEDKDEEVSD